MKESHSFYTACFLLPSIVVSQSIPQGVTYQRLSVRNCNVPITAAFTPDGSTINISYNRTVTSASQTLCIVCNKFEWKSPDYAWISSVNYEGQMDIESGFVAKIDAQIAKYAGSYVQMYTPLTIPGSAGTALKAHHSNSTAPEILYQKYQPGMEICIKTVFSVALASDVSEQTTPAHGGIGPLVQRLSFKWAEFEPWPICERDRSGKPICYGDNMDYSCCREANRSREERHSACPGN